MTYSQSVGSSVVSLRRSADEIRRLIIQQSKRAHVGHIGSGLSVADIVACIYGCVLKADGPNDPDRDRFVLSKGHAALALYCALHLKGWLSAEELNSFCSDGTAIGVHPEHTLDGIDFSTGSLGQGLSIGVGAALAAKMQGSERRTFVLLSDAECNEGSVWEAIMFAGHHRLSNLIAIVDLNGQQALGYTKDVIELAPLAQKWAAFGWRTHEVDGHDIAEMESCIRSITESGVGPNVLIAKTTFGKGVSFMENQIKWHYWPMSDSEYVTALSELAEAKD